MSNIKIFVSHRIDKKSKIFDNDIYIPVRCGAVYDTNEAPNVSLGDNTGDNISEKRACYCELTVLYWAWKNQKADYMGLCHYRRIFATQKELNCYGHGEHCNGCLVTEKIDNDTICKFGLNEEDLEKEIIGYDAVFIKPIDLHEFGLSSNYEAMSKAPAWHNMVDVDMAIKIAKNKYPEMIDVIDEYLFNYRYSYLYNCFVMQQKVFNEFCTWLFDILFDVEQRINLEYYAEKLYRAVGLIGEHFFGIWVLWMKKNKQYKINELPLLFIENTDLENTKIIESVFNNAVSIAMSSSNEYVPYLSVCLESLKENANTEKKYDIVILEQNITDENKKILKEQINTKNMSLRFYNPTDLLKKYNLKYPAQYSLECYFRLVTPIIFSTYKKIIFTDVDLIFETDIAKLFKEDVDGYPLAAVQDFVWSIFINNPELDWKKYAEKTLELKDLYKYYNTGVMVLNLEEFRKNDYAQKLLELVSKTQFRILEQDGLNKFFQSSIKYIDSSWNFPVLNSLYKPMLKYMSFKFSKQYKQDEQQPKIIHFAGGEKPWNNPDMSFAHSWWKYARQSDYYEVILKRMIQTSLFEANNLDNIINLKFSAIKNFKKNCLNYWRVRFLQNFTFGKKREHYIKKKKDLKAKIKMAKDFLK